MAKDHALPSWPGLPERDAHQLHGPLIWPQSPSHRSDRVSDPIPATQAASLSAVIAPPGSPAAPAHALGPLYRRSPRCGVSARNLPKRPAAPRAGNVRSAANAPLSLTRLAAGRITPIRIALAGKPDVLDPEPVDGAQIARRIGIEQVDRTLRHYQKVSVHIAPRCHQPFYETDHLAFGRHAVCRRRGANRAVIIGPDPIEPDPVEPEPHQIRDNPPPPSQTACQRGSQYATG